jgi:acyl-CoA synthetase (AMP-forming)/AMP-acid ligase II
MLLGDVPVIAARKFRDQPAIVFDGGTTTFRQLDDRVRRLANGLGAVAGVGDRVGILMENRPAFVEAYYGVPTAGMVLTFLNYRLNPKELAHIMRDSGATVLMTEPKYLPAVAAIRDSLPDLKLVVCDGDGGDVSYEELLAGASTSTPTAEVSADDVAWLIYTSGTTGQPKGAMLSHRNLLTSLASWLIESSSGPGDAYLMPFPLCHVAGYGVPGYCLRGATLVLRAAYEPGDFMASVDRHRVTGAPLAPTMLNMLLQHPDVDTYDLSSLQTIAYGGSGMPVEVLRAALGRFPDAEFVQGFGMTELAGNVLFLYPATHVRALQGAPQLLAAAGRPMPLVDLRLVDDDMNDVETGLVGEIVVRGDQVMKGYWNNPAATEEAFAGGWFHTGDLGRMDAEGYVYIVDRKKDMIVTGGENVYSRQVEDVLYRHPAVAEAAVIGLPDVHWGETVCAVIVARPGQTVTPEEITAFCKEELAGYKKPRRVEIVDELPKNASGKVLKRQLRDRLSTS